MPRKLKDKAPVTITLEVSVGEVSMVMTFKDEDSKAKAELGLINHLNALGAVYKLSGGLTWMMPD